jgi:uncharacterized protein YhfF
MKNMTPGQMWDAYGEKIGKENLEGKSYTAWHFCNNEEDADYLYPLVLSGQKRATASSLWVYEKEGEPVPKPGDLSIILDWAGNAQCIIKTTQVDIVPYEEVTEEFAAIEGEGDGSLAYWRRARDTFFREECGCIGRDFTEEMPVICEQFEVVYKPE